MNNNVYKVTDPKSLWYKLAEYGEYSKTPDKSAYHPLGYVVDIITIESYEELHILNVYRSERNEGFVSRGEHVGVYLLSFRWKDEEGLKDAREDDDLRTVIFWLEKNYGFQF